MIVSRHRYYSYLCLDCKISYLGLANYHQERRPLSWHVLLVMLVSAAVPALLSVPLRLSLRAILSTRSTQTLASIAALAKLSALLELFPRVEFNKTYKKARAFVPGFFVCIVLSAQEACVSTNPFLFVGFT